MPRPRPLTNVATAIPFEQVQLTPRTPHSASGSRTSRTEQGFAKLQLSDANDFDYDESGTLQSAPLLASSSTARFSVHNSRRGSPITTHSKGAGRKKGGVELLSLAVSRLPLAMGIFIGGILLILIVLSFTRPDALHRYVGAKSPPVSSAPSVPLSSSSVDAHNGAEKNMRMLSYENYTTFPLLPSEYLGECRKMMRGFMKHGDFWDTPMNGAMDVPHHHEDPSVCSSTITYMLDDAVGLTAHLSFIAQAAALAHERNRTFFINDQHWDRGKWTDHFEDVRLTQPGPEPLCKPPPPNEYVACPRTARHWILTARTSIYHLGHGFSGHYEMPLSLKQQNSHGHALNRLKPIFNFARVSLTSVILPSPRNKDLIQLAQQEFMSHLRDGNQRESGDGLTYVAAHLRRGDSKSGTSWYPEGKIPLQDYVDGILSSWARLHDTQPGTAHPPVYLATDSPEAHTEFLNMYNGEVFSLHDATDQRLRELASPSAYYQKKFKDLNRESRITATRGMIVDLSLLSGLWAGQGKPRPDAVVCGLNSAVCKLAAVGMGWFRAFGEVGKMGDLDPSGSRWVDVDQKGRILPVWDAFELSIP